ncbi:11819_t:CDS:2, partial [Funneliformis mosseae]
ITSELPASPLEIHVDDTEIFQLKAISLNFLKNTSEIIDKHTPKLDPCHFCDKEILVLPFLSFTEELALAFEDKDSLAGQEEKRTEVTIHDQVTSLIAYVKEIPELSDIINNAKNDDDDGNNNYNSQIR